MALAFAVARLTWKNIVSMMENNVLLPFTILVERPFITCETHDIVLMTRGPATGLTFIGQDACTVGMSAENQTWIVHYTYHSKPFIYRHQNVIKMHDAVITKVVCGFDLQPITSDADTPVSGNYETVKDIIFMLGGFYDARIETHGDPRSDAQPLTNPISITGNYSQLPLVGKTTEFSKVYGPVYYYAEIFPETFGKARFDTLLPNRPTTAYSVNAICYLGEFYYLNPETRVWSAHTHNTGPFHLTDTMPGTAQVRKNAKLSYSREYVPREGLVPC
jgi:hypothetical protein